MTVFFVFSYAIGVIAIIHALTRPSHAWVDADKNRPYWIIWMVMATLIGMGVLIGALYGIIVVPGFSNSSGSAEFRKR